AARSSRPATSRPTPAASRGRAPRRAYAACAPTSAAARPPRRAARARHRTAGVPAPTRAARRGVARRASRDDAFERAIPRGPAALLRRAVRLAEVDGHPFEVGRDARDLGGLTDRQR